MNVIHYRAWISKADNAHQRRKHPHGGTACFFKCGVRGKYAARFAKGMSVVVLDPGVAKYFPDSDSVNEVLRIIIRVGMRRRRSA